MKQFNQLMRRFLAATVILALAVSGCKKNDPDIRQGEPGTAENPYTPYEAALIVKYLTWTSATVYQKTDQVFVKGIISRITELGTFTESGSYGSASFRISEDGSESNEFECIRVLYLGNRKFNPDTDTDIKVGDEVIICGKLMNYKGNTPQTVAGKCYLHTLNDVTPSEVDHPEENAPGGKNNPYTAVQARDAVKNLTWTSNLVYDKTDIVYVKGKISRVANLGTFTESGSYGNASFWISADGSEYDEFGCYRILYLENKKYTGGTDIKVGDNVVICGKLMNYKGNTPQTSASEAYLYSLNGVTTATDVPESTGTTLTTNCDDRSWSQDTDGTYGSGFVTTAQGLKIGFYKHQSTTNPVTPNSDHVRVYKNMALSIASTEGKKIKKIVIGCAPDVGTASYCLDMSGLEGAANATCDKNALTITWAGTAASKVVLCANNGQVRMQKLTVEFE